MGVHLGQDGRTALGSLRERVPAPMSTKDMAAEVTKPWNPDKRKPDMVDWLHMDKPVRHTERLCMMGNAVPCLREMCSWSARVFLVHCSRRSTCED